MMKLFSTLLLSLTLLLPAALLAADAQVVDIEVTGMTCPFCVYGTEKKLGKLPGVEKAEVSLKQKRARIVMQPGSDADLDAIRKAITEAGFTPGEARVETRPSE